MAIVPRIKKRLITMGYENTIASSKRYRLQVCTKTQTATQRSGFELERRSKIRSTPFQGGPKRDRLETEWSGFCSDVSCVDKKMQEPHNRYAAAILRILEFYSIN